MSSHDHGSEPPNSGALPVVRNIFDVSAEFLGQYKTWLEQNPPSIPVTQIVGYNMNTVRVYKKAPGVLDVANTVTETPVVDELIPSGQMSTTGILRVNVVGDYLNNTGAPVNLTLKIKFGATTVFATTASLTTSATRAPASVQFTLANLGATNSNFLSGEWWYSDTRGAATVGITGIGLESFSSSGATAIDTSISQQLQVTFTHGSASASVSWRRQYYMIEFL